MKLKEIINKFKSKFHQRPSFYDYISKKLGIVDVELAKSISNYIDYFLLSKSEAAMWLKSLNEEIEELRCRIEELENEKSDYSPEFNPDIGGACGLTQEEIELIDQMMAEEYYSDICEKTRVH